MIIRCPHCGADLDHGVKRGLTSCRACNQIFQATRINRLLSAAWEIRKNPTISLETFEFRTKLDPDELQFVYKSIIEHNYSHDEFNALLNKEY